MDHPFRSFRMERTVFILFLCRNFFALLLAGLIPPEGSSERSITKQNTRAERDAVVAVDAFLWDSVARA